MDVAHIPLSLRHEPPIGYFSYPANASSLARATDGEYIPQIDKSSIYHESNTEMLDEISWLVRQDVHSRCDNTSEVLTLQALQDSGGIFESKIKVTSCYYSNPECGKTEYQNTEFRNNMEFVASKHRLDVDGVCGLCHCKLVTQEESALLLRIPDKSSSDITIQTPYLRKNVDELFSNFGSQNLMISRLRETNLQWNNYNIDNDFSNYASLYAATANGQNEILYLAGANTPMAIMGMMAVTSLLDSETNVAIAAIPKLSFIDRKNRPVNVTMKYLREAGISRAAINLVLLQALGVNSEKLTLESREFGLMERRLSSSRFVDTLASNLTVFNDLEPPKSLNRIPNRQDLRRVLKSLSTVDKRIKVNEETIVIAKAIGAIVCDNEW